MSTLESSLVAQSKKKRKRFIRNGRMLQNDRNVGQSASSGFNNMIPRSLRGFHYVPHTRSRVTQSLTVSMTTSLQLHSYSEFPFVLRDQRDKGEEGGKSARLNGG